MKNGGELIVMAEPGEKKDYTEMTEPEQRKCQEAWLRNLLLGFFGSLVICGLIVYFFGCRNMASQ